MVVRSIRAGPTRLPPLTTCWAFARYARNFCDGVGCALLFNDPYPFRDLQPFIKRIFDTYGPRRLLWGSDLSRLKCSYRECLDQFRVSLDFLSEEDKEWILGKTLAAVLNWPEA